MKISGKTFNKKSAHYKKSIADGKAEAERKKGRLARVVPQKNEQGKTIYVVFSASSGGATTKRKGQSKLGGYGRKTLKPSGRQTGEAPDRKRDKSRKAMTPGKRRSASGNTYYENRRNRSDIRPARGL